MTAVKILRVSGTLFVVLLLLALPYPIEGRHIGLLAQTPATTGAAHPTSAAVSAVAYRFVAAWGPPASPGDLNEPGGIATGPDGAVYLADTKNHRIRKFVPVAVQMRTVYLPILTVE